MRHFEGYEQAQRYHLYRPKVHHHLIPLIQEQLGTYSKVRKALDIGCGTGHSTSPLQKLADETIGIDISPGMLQVAQETYPTITFLEAAAEQTGLDSHSVDLITTSMAFHWFDYRAFFIELCRIASPGALLCVYNLWFPGEMAENPSFQPWYRGPYRERFPTPARNAKKLADLIEEESTPLSYQGNQSVQFELDLSREALLGYLCTQSNITSALQKGERLSEIEEWLHAQLKPFFEQDTEKFSYKGYMEFAQIN